MNASKISSLRSSVCNPNDWRIADFTYPATYSGQTYNDISYNKEDNSKYILAGSYLGDTYLINRDNYLVSMFDSESTNSGIMLNRYNSYKAYIEIGGISGRLTEFKGIYWGDNDTSLDHHIARTVILTADDTTSITCTRTGKGDGMYYVFPEGFTGLHIKNKLYMEFKDSTYNYILVHKLLFTLV